MGYLSGMSGALFKTDRNGRRLFFPFGILGKARLLRDEDEEKRERAAYESWFLLMILVTSAVAGVIGGGMAIIESIVGKVALVLGATVLLCGWQAYRVRHLPKVDARYSLMDAWRNSAREHSYTSMIACALGSLMFVVGGCWILTVPTENARWIGAICIAFFGATLAIWCMKIWIKLRMVPDRAELAKLP